jgi:hypothetical protein
MVRKGYTAEQIINKLREAEVLLSHGNTIGLVCKKNEEELVSLSGAGQSKYMLK